MNRKHAVRVARSCMVMEILTTRCCICEKDLHGELHINPDEWEKAINHIMSHSDEERKKAGIVFKGRANSDEQFDNLNC